MLSRFLVVILLFTTRVAFAEIPSPSAFLNLKIGGDRVVADYRQIRSYFRALDEASPRVQVVSLGKTTLGEDMVMAVISSEANMRNVPAIKAAAKRLADPRGLSEADAASLVETGKTVVLVTCNIHSTEIAASQMAMEWAHALAIATDQETKRRLDNVVLLLVPSLNPDGQTMETEWYRKYLGTKYEGGSMPWLYHHYVGHDNNRDWFMMTQKETRNMSRAIYHEWFPQLFVDEHQMGWFGPRLFVPPFADPFDPDIHPLIVREIALVGTNMAYRLEQAGKSGVISSYTFDSYLVGTTRNTGWWKNITGLLTEAASVKFASPIYVHPSELRGGGKGLIEYKAQVSHPNPWKGGWWRLRDVMDYERIASDAILEVASTYRRDFQRNLLTRARTAIESAGGGEAYRIPRAQRDYPTAKRLAQLFADHGVEVLSASNGDFWIPLAQPYSRFVREMMEPQRYPEIKAVAGAQILDPYDVVTWTLPLMMGVTVERMKLPSNVLSQKLAAWQETRGEDALDSTSRPATDSAYLAIEGSSPEVAKVINRVLKTDGNVWTSSSSGSSETPHSKYYVDRASAARVSAQLRDLGIDARGVNSLPTGAERTRRPRVGLYKSWTASMDEGWTRWVLEQYGFDFRNIDNKGVAAGNLAAGLDAIILPDLDRETIISGKAKRADGEMKYESSLPPEFSGGIGKDGEKNLRDFVEAGGTLIAFGAATDYVIEGFNIPVRNVLGKVNRSEFSVPGSLLRVHLTDGHPITEGLPDEVAIFANEPIAFETTVPGAEMQQWILATYPEEERDILLSGWIRGAERLERRAAAVAMTYGKGRIVLFGFRPQHRAQTHATFPLIFNAIYWSTLPPPPL